MKNYQLVSAILASKGWLIDPKFAQNALPLLQSILKGESVQIQRSYAFEEDDRESPEGEEQATRKVVCLAAGTLKATRYKSFEDAPEGSIAFLNIAGPVLKYDDGCGGIGTATMADIVKSARVSTKISGLFIKADTPGGMVDGTPTLADEIRKFSAEKPVVTWIHDGMLASAGYWIAAPSDEIIASQKTDTIGSIGVYTTVVDPKGYYDQNGIKVLEIYAPQSTEKNKDYRDAIAGDETAIKENLKFIASQFIKEVKANRKGKLNLDAADPFKGATYIGEEALKIGLIDGIGDFEYAGQRLQALISSRSSNNASKRAASLERIELTAENLKPTNNTMKISIKGTMTALLALFGLGTVGADESKEFDLSEEHLAKLNGLAGENTRMTQELAAAAADRDKLQNSYAAATKAIEEKEAKIKELEGIIAKYGSKPGASSTSAVKPETDAIEDEASNDIFDANAEHNQTAKRLTGK
jgi:signal peptide peptidase SppA